MKKPCVIFFIAFLGLLVFPPHSAWSETIPEDVLVFRVRGQDYGCAKRNDRESKKRMEFSKVRNRTGMERCGRWYKENAE